MGIFDTFFLKCPKDVFEQLAKFAPCRAGPVYPGKKQGFTEPKRKRKSGWHRADHRKIREALREWERVSFVINSLA